MWHLVIVVVIAYLVGVKFPTYGAMALGKVGL
jgi:hypothetical protein